MAVRHAEVVVVVGAGISGLAAARRLLDGGVRTVVVLEAATRVGGRTSTEQAGGVPVDRGATLVYPVHRNVFRIAERFGVEMFRTGTDGRFTFYADGVAHRFAYGGVGGAKLLGHRVFRPVLRAALSVASRWVDMPLRPAEMTELLGIIDRLDRLAGGVPPGSPWTAPDAAALDRVTLQAWLAAEVRSDSVRRLLDSSLAGYLPPSASMLYALHFLNTWGGIGPLLGQPAQVYRFTGGAQAPALALAGSLGDRVVLASPVREMETGADRVVLRCASGEFEADRVVVAVGPGGCREIRFTPELPDNRILLQEAWRPVHGRKINVVYDEPFWRAAGLSGAALSDLPAAPAVLDASPPDGSAGVLSLYVTVDPDVPRARSGERDRDEVLAGLAEMFGPRALAPRYYGETNWAEEPYSWGCEGGLAAGALTTAQRLPKTPAGRIHWAGVETADAWMGFLSGAIQAGERAAAEVLAARGEPA
ncbi:flavin monoamine oxidase family protein [Nocardia mexicana]|uniref:Monoamine oxidase n=1 Tax=Nocardia mexicana TaxID=279262 RepID=A0A370H1W4_9NOCA|nr:NAD(P)/FAD-dependent oxidoreductase [Nocardia mexicana]RDI49608.1 monoamine oxidase [Nocardia mexicana]